MQTDWYDNNLQHRLNQAFRCWDQNILGKLSHDYSGLDTNGCPLGNSKFILLSDNLGICLWLSACQVGKIYQNGLNSESLCNWIPCQCEYLLWPHVDILIWLLLGRGRSSPSQRNHVKISWTKSQVKGLWSWKIENIDTNRNKYLQPN